MKKLVLITLIIGVLIISGCTQDRRETSVQPTVTESSPSGNDIKQPANNNSQKDIPVNFISSGFTPKEAAEKLKAGHGLPGEMKAGGFGVKWNDNLGIPQTVLGFRTTPYSGTPQDAAAAFLQEYGDLIKLENSSIFFSEVSKSGDETYVVYEQRYKGIPFYNGGVVRTLVTNDNRVRQLSIDYFPGAKFLEVSKADQSVISNTLREYLIGRGIEGSELDSLMDYLKPESIIYPLDRTVTNDTKFRLTWLYRIPSGDRLFIDASTAETVGDERR